MDNTTGRTNVTEAILEDKPVVPSSAELISRAKSLVPLLRANANLADRLGRLPEENVEAIEEAGLFRMLMPVNRGGYGTDAATAAIAMTHIASGCPSTAWDMQIYFGIGRMAESLPEQTLAEIYASGLTPNSPAPSPPLARSARRSTGAAGSGAGDAGHSTAAATTRTGACCASRSRNATGPVLTRSAWSRCRS